VVPGEGGGSGGGGGGKCDGDGEGETSAVVRPPPEVAVDVEVEVVVLVPVPEVVVEVDAEVSVCVPAVEVETVLEDWVELRVVEELRVEEAVEVHEAPTGAPGTQTSEAASGRLVADAEARTMRRAAMRTRADANSRVEVPDHTPPGCRALVLRSGLMQRRLSSLGHLPHLNAPGGTPRRQP
jgi:hypothetical protein